MTDRSVVIKELFQNFAETFPQYREVLDAFLQTIILRENLLKNTPDNLEDACKKLLYHDEQSLTVLEKEALKEMTSALLDTLVKGFPEGRISWRLVDDYIKTHEQLILMLFSVSENTISTQDIANVCGLPMELLAVLDLLALHFSRFCGVIATKHLSNHNVADKQTTCPRCHARPEMSIITEDGKRKLICKRCNLVWHYDRTNCANCASNKSIRQLYNEDQPDLRVTICDECHGYLLEVDLRGKSIPVELANLYGLIMGHLDALALQEDAHAISFLPI